MSEPLPRQSDMRSALVFVEPIFDPGGVRWHGMAIVGGEIVNDFWGNDRTSVLDDCLYSLKAAGIGGVDPD